MPIQITASVHAVTTGASALNHGVIPVDLCCQVIMVVLLLLDT